MKKAPRLWRDAGNDLHFDGSVEAILINQFKRMISLMIDPDTSVSERRHHAAGIRPKNGEIWMSEHIYPRNLP